MGYTCNFDNAPPKLREAFYSLVGMRWRYWNEPWGTDTPGHYCMIIIVAKARPSRTRKVP